MASGIAIADACVEAFTALEKERKHSFLVLRISEDMSQITVEKTFPPKADDLEAEWKESIKVLPTNDCRYIVTDFRWKDGPTVTKSKICSILWAPDGAPMRSKMIYSSSHEALTSKVRVQRTLQANDPEDVGYKAVKDSLSK